MIEVDAGGRAEGSVGRCGEATSHPEGPRKGERTRDRGEARGATRRARERNRGGFIIISNVLLCHLPMAKKRPQASARERTLLSLALSL